MDANGHLGTVTSSARFKEAITPIDKTSEAILALKPVSFRYKHDLDPKGVPQFGLIAEQVAKMIAFVLQGKHVVAWNLEFDYKLLMHMYRKYGEEPPKVAGLSCSMDKYSEWVGEWSKRKNGFKWQRLPNLAGMPAHDAFSDCVSTLRVIEKMAGKYDPSTVDANDLDLNF